MDDLTILRRNGMRLLTAICAAFFGITAIGAFWADSGWLPVILALVTPAFPVMLVLQNRVDGAERNAMALAVISFPMIWLYQWAGHRLMIDVHMTFFAALATLVVLADWRPVLTAAVATAAHHLLTNFLAPWLVYPDGADFARVLFHAVVVVVETGALIALCHQLEDLVIRQADAREAQAQAEREVASQRAEVEAEQREVIETIGQRLESLAQGNLADRITQTFPASYERLRLSFNSAVADLDEIVSSMLGSVVQITNGSDEIRTAADDLARRTEEQASSLEQNSSTTQHLTGRIEVTANAASEVNRSINDAQRGAELGGEVVERAINAMQAIEQSSSEIAQIITIIDGIAFQTNLLALNAGVEAARAGDAGKGFAVVANEVRALAQRSADAAHDIKALITASSEQVGRGVTLVSETGNKLKDIVQQVNAIGGAINAIAGDAGQQARELRTVSESFARIESVTQQNAAMVEESTAAAHSLQREANSMRALVHRFTTTNRAATSDTNARRWNNGLSKVA